MIVLWIYLIGLPIVAFLAGYWGMDETPTEFAIFTLLWPLLLPLAAGTLLRAPRR